MIGSPSAIEGKDMESSESCTVRDGPTGLSKIDVNHCLLAGLGGVTVGSTIKSTRLATSASKAASEGGVDSVAFLSSVERTKRSLATCCVRDAIVDR